MLWTGNGLGFSHLPRMRLSEKGMRKQFVKHHHVHMCKLFIAISFSFRCIIWEPLMNAGHFGTLASKY